MSRCFPFPPPGYDKKIIVTSSDLLKKEKHREKKHKKEKKDREKKDDEEKKERDRSNGKSREKKDKKEKHRDKKKEKTKDKYQKTDNPSPLGEAKDKAPPEESAELMDSKILDTHILLDDRRSSGNSVGYKGQNLGHYTSLEGKPNGVIFEQDFDRRDRDGTKTVGGQTGERINFMHQKRNGGDESFYPNNHLANNFEDSDLALELDRRLKNEAEQLYHQNHTVNKLTGAPQKKDIRVIKTASLDTVERDDGRIKGAIGSYDQAKDVGMTMVPHVSTPPQLNHARMPRPPLGNNIGVKLEVPEGINRQEDELTDRGKKRKDKDRNGNRKNLGTDTSRNKEGKEEKGSNRGDRNITAQSTRGSHKMETICPPNHESHFGNYYKRNMPKEEELSQTKERLTNGIYHVTGPSKLSRPSSIHLHNDNGKALELHQIPVKPSPDGQNAADKIKVDKVGKVNGIIETHLQRPATEQVVQPRRPSPHPDAKRFNEVLSIPRIDELSELGDSDWLFNSNERSEKKLRMDACCSADMPLVWSKATNIDSADVYALPYVIPY